MVKKSNLPSIVSPDPQEQLREQTTALEQYATSAQYEGSFPHSPQYSGYNRSWVFGGEELPHFVDETKTPYQIVCDTLGFFKRAIWTAFYVYVLPDMEAAFIRQQQIEHEKKYNPVLLGTMLIKMKDDAKQYYFVRFIEKLGSQGFRKIEIVENKHVTGGSSKQHEYICGQIYSMPWYVGYAEPWESGMITTEELLMTMEKQGGFAKANTEIRSS